MRRCVVLRERGWCERRLPHRGKKLLKLTFRFGVAGILRRLIVLRGKGLLSSAREYLV